jgi:hypothetical protein
MSRVWVNNKFFTSDNKKAEKWKPAAQQEKVFWGLCGCGEIIHEGDAVGMYGDHLIVVCYACWLTGRTPNLHLDCAGLKLPGLTLSQ